MKTWLAIVIGSVVSVAALWGTTIPLGIPPEWWWDRAETEPDWIWNLAGGAIAAGLFTAFVLQGWVRMDARSSERSGGLKAVAWLIGLVIVSFTWLWIVQEVAPSTNRLGKSAFVLYYVSSSGYFTRARYDQPQPATLLADYEDLMRQGDVLHTGTHPPGLFLAFHGLIEACEASPRLCAALDATQPFSFREACDIIAANNMRRPVPLAFSSLDRRVLWLATLLVMLAASLAVIPLYGLLCRSVSRSTAWVCAALWPAIPAVAIFIPKSDVVFPLIGLLVIWTWLRAWDRQSTALALLASLIAWCGLMCSLAFLPVFLAAILMTVGAVLNDSLTDVEGVQSGSLETPSRQFVRRRILWTVFPACLGFAAPTLALWRFAQVNMLNVWWLNFYNHAGFYRQYERTYWKWLLENPVEVSFAAGWPVALLALIGLFRVVRESRSETKGRARSRLLTVVGPLALVWGILWLSGKNSGETARIWILLFPWLIWLAAMQFEEMSTGASSERVRKRGIVTLLAVQFLVCLLTVTRVRGFHADLG